ncbi:MAG: head GIN domain-containing protein [Hyphomonadaceae bacterium]|nr:head GIN domain-containing protein [Hyphomonadaceae bacterium]
MKRIYWLLPAAALATTGGCVMTEPSESRTFSQSGFDSIDASGGVNLVLKQGPYSIKAEGPKSKLDKLVIAQEGTTLSIHREPVMNWFSVNVSDRDIVTITAPNYARIAASGGVDIETTGLRLPALAIKVSGGADIDATGFNVDQLTVDTSGGGDVNLAGSCKSVTIDASGGADFNGENFACESATVTAASGADVEVRASAVASGRASSGADIRFLGNPATFTSDHDSGGEVELRAP